MKTVEVSLITPKVHLANVEKNEKEIEKYIKKYSSISSDIMVFPEMALSGYTCADLLFQNELLERCRNALLRIADIRTDLVIVVGSPLYINSKVYNCAIVIYNNLILGIVPKTYLPSYGEFYENRWFDFPENTVEYSDIDGKSNSIPVGNSIIFKMNEDLSFCIDVCEDVWSPIPPSTINCLNGANLVLNLSASNEIVGKRDYRTSLVSQQSAKLNCAYAYVSSGLGESTTDTLYLGNHIISQNGKILVNKQSNKEIITTEIIDYGLLNSERKRNTTFKQSKRNISSNQKSTFVDLYYSSIENKSNIPKVSCMPFVPEKIEQRYEDITNIQKTALQRRMKHIGCENVVIGVSGGLDSTLALLVTVGAFDLLNLNRKGIKAVSMPCFGTTNKTRTNAKKLCEALGVDFQEIDISESVNKHMEDIDLDKDSRDVTYENCQARERTQVLMDLANKYSGIVIGTGDMSEIAIGWCTYNGDHMSMYNVNCGIPKTLVKYLVSMYRKFFKRCNNDINEALLSIENTEISPELLPPNKDGNIAQKTEDIIGPYELVDFYLFYTLRYDFSDEKIIKLAYRAFEFRYNEDEIRKWHELFKKRFYASQFKRSCVPDGPKIGTIALSPRADLRMPSDAVL